MPTNKHVAVILVTSLFFLWGFPVIMGRISDASIQIAYLVPAACFIVVFLFAKKNINVEKLKLSIAY